MNRRNCRRVHKHDFGEDWPLTVRCGIIRNEEGALVFRSSGIDFALNGIAQIMGYSEINSIWKSDKSLVPLINKGLE